MKLRKNGKNKKDETVQDNLVFLQKLNSNQRKYVFSQMIKNSYSICPEKLKALQ